MAVSIPIDINMFCKISGNEMKGVISDFFDQSSKQNEKVTLETNNGSSKMNSSSEETAVKEIGDNLVSDGKENAKAKGKPSNGKPARRKPKSLTKKSPPQKKKVIKKKSLSTKKPNHLDTLESSAAVNIKDKVADSPQTVSKFSLRIRMKSKDQEDHDNLIDDFSSPEGKSKELKSPQGSMFKYLVSPKNPHTEKGCSSVTKSTAMRDISDFFSPKGKSPNTIPAALPVAEENEQELRIADKSGKPTADKPLNKATKATKSARKSKANPVSSLKKSDTEDANDKAEVGEVSIQSAKSSTKGKAKSVKKSLSLTKNETVTKAAKSPVCHEGPSLLISDAPESSVTKSVNNAFQAIMSKSLLNKTEPPQIVPDMFSKKRKRENDDEVNAEKPSKTVKEDSPIKSKKRCSTSNQIESDSDNEISSIFNGKISEALSDIHQVSKIENHAQTVDALSKSEESKRNSLKSYFSKVTKEEALAKEDKIELKVQAMVHSPPSTPSKKNKRRSVNSLPGGALSLSKKKANVKAKLKENINAIDVMDVDETKGNDAKNKDSSRATSKKQSSPSSKLSKHSVKSQTLNTPQKSLSLKTSEPSTLKRDTSKSAKKSLSRGKGKQEMKNKPASDIDPKQSVKSSIVDEECLAVPLPGPQDEAAIETPKTPSDKWTMRVCLTPVQIPSSQGTLLGE